MSRQTKEMSKEQSHKDCFLFFKNNIYLFLGMGIAVAICMYGIIGVFGFSAFPDEFGYWSPAAAVLGYDWSEITGLGSYYSYGYSALLVPILLLFHGAITTYRAAVVLNLLFQCASVVLLFLIMKELFPDESRNTSAIIVTIASLYPAWLFYVQTTMAEATLYFGVILSIYLMLRFLKHPGVVSGLFWAVILVYLYLVHMRCLGTIAAGTITIFIWIISQRKNKQKKSGRSLLLLLTIVGLFALSFVLKDRIIELLYHRTADDVLSWNDYSGILFRIKKIINLKGLGYLFKDLCGKLLYMGLSTFGIAYFGMTGCIKRASRSLKNIRKIQSSCIDFLWIYISLIVVFQLMVALVYLNGASAPEADRMDNFLHGRYIDFFLPILFVVGLEDMLHLKKIYPGIIASGLLYLFLSIVAYFVILGNDLHMRNAHGFTMIGMSHFLERPLPDPLMYFKKEVALLSILIMIVYVVVAIARRTGQHLLIALVLVIQVILGVEVCTKYIFQNQSYIYEDILLGDKLKEMVETYPDRDILHIYEGGVPYIELVQFGYRNAKISVVNGENTDINIAEYLDKNTILITSEEQEYEETVDEFYDEKWVYGHLILNYTE